MTAPDSYFGILWLIPIALAMCMIGRQINRWICPHIASNTIAPMERSAFSLATGAIVASQGILVLGLKAHLDAKSIAIWFTVLAIIGIAEFGPIVRDILESIRGFNRSSSAHKLWILMFGLLAIGAVSGSLLPPVSSEWDSLSYHLADAKMYVAAQKIYYIPWESHSNFAFNMEMLYCVGLIAGGIPAAKIFAFKIGVISVVAVYYLGRRILRSSNSGMLAALIFATLPLVFWESGTAYVDLCATSFAAMGLLALVLMAKTGERRYAWLAGVMMGGMLGIKATALVTLGMYAIGIVAYAKLNSPGTKRAVLSAVGMVVIALLVGSSWYVKSFSYTGNPVYPFAYSIFGGKNWDLGQSAAYAADQASFGMGHKPSDLLLVPWNLSMYLVPGHPVPEGFPKPFNDYQSVISSLSPLFLIVLIAALVSRSGFRRGMRLLVWYCSLAIAAWFVLTQQVRYLLPVTPALCLICEKVLLELYSRKLAAKLAASIAIAAGLGFNIFIDILLSAQHWQTFSEGPAAITSYQELGLPCYKACEFINTETPDNYGVVTYGEPETLYLNQPHMWGESGHSTVIPYSSFTNAADLRAWLIHNGFHTILINTHYAQVSSVQPGWAGLVAQLTVDSGVRPEFSDRGIYVYGL